MVPVEQTKKPTTEISPRASRKASGRRGTATPHEEAADQLVRHVQHRIRQSLFQVEDGDHENRAPSVYRVAPELMSIGRVTLPHKLPQTLLMNTTGYFGFQADATDQLEPVEQFVDVIRSRCDCGRFLSQPNDVSSRRDRGR